MLILSRSRMTFLLLAVVIASVLTGCDFLGPNWTGI